jgi:CheY-like chemotaxis protein
MMVDDNSVNLRVGMGLLRPFGMRVITASGGAEEEPAAAGKKWIWCLWII